MIKSQMFYLMNEDASWCNAVRQNNLRRNGMKSMVKIISKAPQEKSKLNIIIHLENSSTVNGKFNQHKDAVGSLTYWSKKAESVCWIICKL